MSPSRNRKAPARLTGIISVTRKGVGYVAHDDYEEDVEVAPHDLNTALNGDEVTVEVTGARRGRMVGAVTAVRSRAKEVFVGTLVREAASFSLRADDPRFYPTVRIPAAQVLDATEGTKVLARIVRWQSGKVDPVGEVVEIIGPAGTHETEMRAAVLSRGMRLVFPDAVEKEARALEAQGVLPKQGEARRDMRSVPTFTIDPEDAKDFDDAISVQVLPDGLYEIGIHIADVTHYVEPGSALDREARERATSIYLVDRTIPMLPEVLSNDLCSLKPHVDRLTFSAIFTIDDTGRVHSRWFGKTIIHSDMRFTYQGAQAVLDAGAGIHHTELEILARLGKTLRASREDNGAIAFDTDEVKFELDEQKKPVRAFVKERIETMRIIEDWMLLANKEVAAFVAHTVRGKDPQDQVFIYRIHDVPDSDRIEELRIFLKAIGHDLGEPGAHVRSKDINRLMVRIKGTPEEAMVQMATLRSMAKAVYSHKNIGHFSLAFSHYTHFTSPIRRYPDMMVHRILQSHLGGGLLSRAELAAYQKAAMYCSEREVAAVEAERDSIKYKQVEYMSTRVGQLFDGVVTGITENGLFIAERETRAEGMIHVSGLSDDYFEYYPKRYALVGTRTKKTFRLGDAVRIKLISAHIDARRIDWALA